MRSLNTGFSNLVFTFIHGTHNYVEFINFIIGLNVIVCLFNRWCFDVNFICEFYLQLRWWIDVLDFVIECGVLRLELRVVTTPACCCWWAVGENNLWAIWQTWGEVSTLSNELRLTRSWIIGRFWNSLKNKRGNVAVQIHWFVLVLFRLQNEGRVLVCSSCS